MKTFKILFCVLILSTLACAEHKTGENAEEGVAITVYNDDFGVVKQRKIMDFSSGINTVKFTDVASAIEPASVNFKCLSTPGAVSVLEQNYEYDVVNTQSLLKKFIDKNVTIQVKGAGVDPGRMITGRLCNASGSELILKNDKSIDIVSRNTIEAISLADIAGGLVTKPTLVWLADSKTDSKELCQITYTTGQISWQADYSAILNQQENAIDLTGWVTIDNQSGTAYEDAKIKLIAGDVRRVKKPQPRYKGNLRMECALAADASAGFEEKSFMEYHMYTLGRASTINNNQTKQIEFITPAENVPAEKVYIYQRYKKADKVQIKIEFENKDDFGLGIALPKGKVRVFKSDPADDSLEFVGEDTIDHTPRKEKLSLYIGDAFDIAVEYKQVDSRVSRRRRWQKHSVELRNRKDSPVTVFVDEKFGAWVNWKIEDSNFGYEKLDAATARFSVNIDADSVATLEYSAEQWW